MGVVNLKGCVQCKGGVVTIKGCRGLVVQGELYSYNSVVKGGVGHCRGRGAYKKGVVHIKRAWCI